MGTTVENLDAIIQQLTLLEVDIRDLHASNLALNTEVAATLNLKITEVAAAIEAFNSANLSGLTDKALARANLGLVKPIKGIWIPSLSGNSVLDVQYATYTDYGEYYRISWDFIVTTLGTGSLAQLHGLPFPCGSEYGHVDVTYYNGSANSIYGVDAYAENDASHLQFLPKHSQSHGVGGGAFFANSMRCFGSALIKKAV